MVAVTLDPAHVLNATLSNGNLTILATAANGQSISTTSYSTGKYHLEFTHNAGASANMAVGLASASHALTNFVGQDTTSFGLWSGTRTAFQTYFNNSGSTIVTNCGWTVGDTVVVEIDFGAKLIWFQNVTAAYNQWNGSSTANPATGSGGASFSSLTGAPYLFNANPYASSMSCTINFGATAFAMTPSTGFSAWQSAGPPPVTTPSAAGLMVGV